MTTGAESLCGSQSERGQPRRLVSGAGRQVPEVGCGRTFWVFKGLSAIRYSMWNHIIFHCWQLTKMLKLC